MKDTENYIFKLNYETCDRKKSNDEGSLLFSCDKLKSQEYHYSFGKHNDMIPIIDNKTTYNIFIDNNDYIVDSHTLILDKNLLIGTLGVKEKKEGIFKYANTQYNIPLKLYDTEINEANINNGLIKFKKNWDEISNIYYSHKKLYTKYSIENNVYKSSKYYLLSKTPFSIGKVNDIYEYIYKEYSIKVSKLSKSQIESLNKVEEEKKVEKKTKKVEKVKDTKKETKKEVKKESAEIIQESEMPKE